RTLKRNAGLLSVVALIVFVISRPLDLIFLINPAFHPGGLFIHWLDFALLVGIGGIWLALFAWQLKRVPVLYPVHDPRLKSSHEEVAHGQHATSHA
ncbi:MAG: hypothetical protein R3264_05440, partial [Anaerolineae bacterium]|nr:hypothetical protein [Anaerolineae bacterium]